MARFKTLPRLDAVRNGSRLWRMSGFLTLTANALWETTYEVPAWQEGGTARAVRETVQVGGKGINVALALRLLGADAAAVTFLGGATGALCRAWLHGRGLPLHDFPAGHATRSGAVVRAPGRAETTFLGEDGRIDSGALETAAAFLDGLPDTTVLAVCGSVPRFAPDTHGALAAALERRARRAPLAVDSYGPFLQAAARWPLALVKANRVELGTLLGREVARGAVRGALVEAARGFPGIRAWVVTDGPGEVWCLADGGEPCGWQPAPVREVSPVGAGDTVLAALLDGVYRRGESVHAALPRALALASAKATRPEAVWIDESAARNLPPQRLSEPSTTPRP